MSGRCLRGGERASSANILRAVRPQDFVGNPVVVRRRNGKEQTVHYTGVLPYESWMENANVVLAEDLCGCGDLLDQNTAVLQRLRNYRTAYIRPQAEARKERHEEGRAYLDFPVNKTTLYPDYRNNPQELEKILRTINVVREDRNTTITHISIHGYASPEDTYEHNSYLAENRALMLKDYVCRLLELDEKLFKVEYTPELGWLAALRERQQPGAQAGNPGMDRPRHGSRRQGMGHQVEVSR